MNMAMRGVNVRVSVKSERTHSIPVSSSLALSIAMVGLDFPDVHEKHFPTCLRGRWLEDAARTAERWCMTFFVASSIGSTCLTTGEPSKISMNKAHVGAVSQCEKIIGF